MTQRLGKLFVLLLLGSVCLIACAGAAEATVPAPTATVETALPTDTLEVREEETAPEVLDLDIKGFLFRPMTVAVKVGTTVRWTNLDDIQHFVTNGTPDEVEDKFDSGPFFQNEKFSYTFNEPGEYAYFCQRHPHMQATIIVEE